MKRERMNTLSNHVNANEMKDLKNGESVITRGFARSATNVAIGEHGTT